MKFAHCLLPFLLAMQAVPAAADTLTDLLPPDTKVVFGIRVPNLALSSVAQTFAAQAHAAAAGWLKAVPLDGIDLLRDIDEVLIASTGRGQNPPSIIVVTGRFDVARLAAGAKLYREVPLLTGEVETGSAVALLENGTAILGDAALVRAAIDQRAGKNRIDSALNDRITSLRQRYDIWGLGERPEGFVAPTPEAKVLESIDRFQFGVQLASGLELAAEIHARSPEDTEKLNVALATIAAMVKGTETSGSAAKFDLQAEGGTLKLTVFIPDEELKKTIEAETAILSPVSTQLSVARLAPVTSAETAETSPSGAPDAPPVAPAPAAPPKMAAPAQAFSKPPTPKVLDTAPKVLDTAPKVLDTAPKVLDTAPKVLDTAPKVLDTAPKVLDKEKDTDTVVLMLPGKK